MNRGRSFVLLALLAVAAPPAAAESLPDLGPSRDGRALDIYLDDAVFRWLERHARRFGFRRTVRGEPWHWEYVKRPRRRR